MPKDKGYINQHKEMAMGKMPDVSGNSGKTGFEQNGPAAKPSSIKKRRNINGFAQTVTTCPPIGYRVGDCLQQQQAEVVLWRTLNRSS